MVDMEIRFDYSSDVLLRLEVAGLSWPIAKIGPDHFVPAKRFELAPCTGEIVMTVDEQERRWSIRLTNGVCLFDSAVSYQRSDH